MARIKYYDATTGTWKYGDHVAYAAPVQSVNGKTGAVNLTAADVGADASGAIAAHNADTAAHPHILGLLATLENKAMLKSDISIKKAKLTLEDGSQILIDVVVASEGTTIITYTNQVPISIDTDKNVFNGKGYQENLRLSSSGTTKALTGSYVTGFIPVKAGDVVRIWGMNWLATTHAMNYICGYDSSFNLVGYNSTTANTTPTIADPSGKPVVSAGWTYENGNLTFTAANLANLAYIRVNSKDFTDPAAMIITVNEEITD